MVHLSLLLGFIDKLQDSLRQLGRNGQPGSRTWTFKIADECTCLSNELWSEGFIISYLDQIEIDDSFPILKFEKVSNANQYSLIVKNCLKTDFTIYTARCTNEAGETEEYQASLSEVTRNRRDTC